jgi:hypothetical protein
MPRSIAIDFPQLWASAAATSAGASLIERAVFGQLTGQGADELPIHIEPHHFEPRHAAFDQTVPIVFQCTVLRGVGHKASCYNQIYSWL